MVNNYETEDVMIPCFLKMSHGAENLVRLLATSNGKTLFEEISQNLGNDDALKVFDDKVSAERLMLCAKSCELKRTQDNSDVPIM